MIKNIFRWIALLILCLINIATYASCQLDENTEIIKLHEKFYVKIDQINFEKNKIHIQLESIVYETPAIHSDKDGYFIDKIASSGNCSWYEWQCAKCHFCNLRGIDYRCRECRFPMSY